MEQWLVHGRLVPIVPRQQRPEHSPFWHKLRVGKGYSPLTGEAVRETRPEKTA